MLSLDPLTPGQLAGLIELAGRLKRAGAQSPQLLAGRTLAMIFQKASTRTRVSFEVAMLEQGGRAICLNAGDLQLGRGETIADTGRVLARYVDAVMVRTYAQGDLEELAAAADIPVINGLTDAYHPCQALADLLTITERRGTVQGSRIAYIGDGNNVAHSLMMGGARLGATVVVATPPQYAPAADVVARARKGAANGGMIELTADPAAAAQGADVLYTDTWVSMGQEREAEVRAHAFAGYQLDEALVARAKPDVMVMHDLPAYRGKEIAAAVMDGPQAVIWEQAENRLHAQKALLCALLA
ncbi:MAG TPA: ornithine carbamoyltransferase [Limnochordia bacterium]|nr:ornithine carbamoyltransferase [Limnochordia bacterium]